MGGSVKGNCSCNLGHLEGQNPGSPGCQKGQVLLHIAPLTHTQPQRGWKPWSPPLTWEASNVFLIEIEASRNREIYWQKLYHFWDTWNPAVLEYLCMYGELWLPGEECRPGCDRPGGRPREAGSKLPPCLSRGTGCPMGPADATTFSWECL